MRSGFAISPSFPRDVGDCGFDGGIHLGGIEKGSISQCQVASFGEVGPGELHEKLATREAECAGTVVDLGNKVFRHADANSCLVWFSLGSAHLE